MNYDFQSLFKLHPKKILEEASKIKSKSLTKKLSEILYFHYINTSLAGGRRIKRDESAAWRDSGM